MNAFWTKDSLSKWPNYKVLGQRSKSSSQFVKNCSTHNPHSPGMSIMKQWSYCLSLYSCVPCLNFVSYQLICVVSSAWSGWVRSGVMSCHVMPCHVMSWYDMSGWVRSRQVRSGQLMAEQDRSSQVGLDKVWSGWVGSGLIWSSQVRSCLVKSDQVGSSHFRSGRV